MRLSGNEPCPCGSGRKAKRCHWPGRWVDNVTAAEQQALAEAHNFPAFHPDIRPRGERFDAFAERVAKRLPEGPLSALPDEVWAETVVGLIHALPSGASRTFAM